MIGNLREGDMGKNKVNDLLSELKLKSPNFAKVLHNLHPGQSLAYLNAKDMEQHEIACCLSINLEHQQGE